MEMKTRMRGERELPGRINAVKSGVGVNGATASAVRGSFGSGVGEDKENRGIEPEARRMSANGNST